MTNQQLTDTPLGTAEMDPAARENEAVIRDALAVIDGALAQMVQRELVSSGEVADLLLDVRTLLVTTTKS